MLAHQILVPGGFDAVMQAVREYHVARGVEVLDKLMRFDRHGAARPDRGGQPLGCARLLAAVFARVRSHVLR